MTPRSRIVPCPRCGAAASFDASNRWRPFCSERCRSIDLGAWAAGDYRVASTPPSGAPLGDGSDGEEFSPSS